MLQLGTITYNIAKDWDLPTILKRLEAQDLTAGREVSSPDAPPRTEYTLTEAGQQRLNQWLDEPLPSPSVRRIRVDFLSRLYVAHLLKRPTDSIIARQRLTCRQRYQELVAERDRTQTGIAALALELMLAQYGAILVWLDTCE